MLPAMSYSTTPSFTRITLTSAPLEHARRCKNFVRTAVYKHDKRKRKRNRRTRDTEEFYKSFFFDKSHSTQSRLERLRLSCYSLLKST